MQSYIAELKVATMVATRIVATSIFAGHQLVTTRARRDQHIRNQLVATIQVATSWSQQSRLRPWSRLSIPLCTVNIHTLCRTNFPQIRTKNQTNKHIIITNNSHVDVCTCCTCFAIQCNFQFLTRLLTHTKRCFF